MSLYGIGDAIAVANTQEGTMDTMLSMTQPMTSTNETGNSRKIFEQFMKDVEIELNNDKQELKGDMMSQMDSIKFSADER